MRKIETARQYRGRDRSLIGKSDAELAPRLFWQASRGVNFNAETAGDEYAIQAYVNHGRWLAECPDCHGAQVTSPDDRRFMCHCCGNEEVGGRWRAVVWPAKARAIEQLLELRPKPENQNWRPGETVADLIHENDTKMGRAD